MARRVRPTNAPQGAAALAELLAGVGSPARSVDLTEEPEDVLGALFSARRDESRASEVLDADAAHRREGWRR